MFSIMMQSMLLVRNVKEEWLKTSGYNIPRRPRESLSRGRRGMLQFYIASKRKLLVAL